MVFILVYRDFQQTEMDSSALSLSSSSDISQIYKPAVKQTSYRLLSPLSVLQLLLSWSSSLHSASAPGLY